MLGKGVGKAGESGVLGKGVGKAGESGVLGKGVGKAGVCQMGACWAMPCRESTDLSNMKALSALCHESTQWTLCHMSTQWTLPRKCSVHSAVKALSGPSAI